MKKWEDLTRKEKLIGASGTCVIILVIFVCYWVGSSEYSKHVSEVKTGLYEIGYSWVKGSDQYCQFKYDTGLKDHYAVVDYGVPKMIKDAGLEGRISFAFGKDEKGIGKGIDRWQYIKAKISNDQILNKTIQLLGKEMAGNQVSMSEIIAGIDTKISQNDYSRLTLSKGKIRFELKFAPDYSEIADVRCRFVIDI